MHRGSDLKCTEVLTLHVLTFENACLGMHGSAIDPLNSFLYVFFLGMVGSAGEPLNARLEKLINKEVRVYIHVLYA